MPSINDRRPPSDLLLVSAIVLCLTCDFLMVPASALMLAADPILGLIFSSSLAACVLAQGCLLAAWMAWSDQPFWRRFKRHWTVVAILYAVWTAGLCFIRPNAFAEFGVFVGLSIPLVSIAAQTPLWIARLFLGWRLIRSDPSNDAGPAPLSIRDLMVATLMVALALALARLAPSPDGKEIGALWMVMFVAASVASAVTMMPASALLLRVQPFQRGIFSAGLYAAFWVGLLWLVVFVGLSTGLFPVPPVGVVLAASCLIVSFAATVVFVAAIAHGYGYRLVWGLSRRAAAIASNTLSVPIVRSRSPQWQAEASLVATEERDP